MRILLALIFILSAAMAHADDAPYRLSVQLPSIDAKQLGERFHLHLELQVDTPYELDESRLPHGARVGLHLRQDRIKLQSRRGWSAREYQIDIPYQVIGQGSIASYVVVPHLVLNLKHADEIYPVVVESFSVDIAAGMEMSERSPGEALLLKPARSPPLLATQNWMVGFSVSMLLLLAILMVELFHVFFYPLWCRYQRPFARANRALSRLPGQEHYLEKIQLMHLAVDASAQQTVLSCDLNLFLEKNPEFGSAEDLLREFFEASDRLLFHARTATDAKFDVNLLVARCADLEALQP